MAAPSAELRNVVAAVASATVQVEFHHVAGGTGVWAVAAIEDSQSAIVARRGEEITLWLERASDLVDTLLAGIPPQASSAAASCNLPLEEFARAQEIYAEMGVGALLDMLGSLDLDHQETNTLRATIAAEYGNGSLSVRRRVTAGDWSYPSPGISWRDTPNGRLTVQRDGSWVTISAADYRRLRTLGTTLLTQCGLIDSSSDWVP
jgi:hypothetical protein